MIRPPAQKVANADVASGAVSTCLLPAAVMCCLRTAKLFPELCPRTIPCGKTPSADGLHVGVEDFGQIEKLGRSTASTSASIVNNNGGYGSVTTVRLLRLQRLNHCTVVGERALGLARE